MVNPVRRRTKKPAVAEYLDERATGRHLACVQKSATGIPIKECTSQAERNTPPRHFRSAAEKLGLVSEVDAILTEILAATPKVISSVTAILPAGFPQRVADSIFAGLKESAEQIQKPVGLS